MEPMTELRRRAATMTIPLGSVAALSSATSESEAVPIEIRVVGRWNACALLDCLAPYRSFLIQQGAERWVVRAQAPGCHGEDLDSAIAAIDDCLDEHGIEIASMRIDGKPYRSAATSARRP